MSKTIDGPTVAATRLERWEERYVAATEALKAAEELAKQARIKLAAARDEHRKALWYLAMGISAKREGRLVEE